MEFLRITKTNGDRISINPEQIAYAMIYPESIAIHFDKELRLSVGENEVEKREYDKILMDFGFLRGGDEVS
jgi:hypothetical protein